MFLALHALRRNLQIAISQNTRRKHIKMSSQVQWRFHLGEPKAGKAGKTWYSACVAGGGLAGGILARTCLEEWNLTKGICYTCSIPQSDMHHKQVLAQWPHLTSVLTRLMTQNIIWIHIVKLDHLLRDRRISFLETHRCSNHQVFLTCFPVDPNINFHLPKGGDPPKVWCRFGALGKNGMFEKVDIPSGKLT